MSSDVQSLREWDPDYDNVWSLFRKGSHTAEFSLQIEKIQKVDNQYLRGQFEMKKREYLEKYKRFRIVQVFHGTKKSNIPSILRDKLKVDRHGKNKGTRLELAFPFQPFPIILAITAMIQKK